ncbi:hypothetical protein [Candidatus Protochlamydia phocaeensis]|uniref:hypothetical protein n=1 Tax=Candidatus Protochlamydia phocaeensis TaxID=1414722 RepID=UPI000838A4D3|nr:hypothetical protein [Candidatus Protochlamydia phocaeensis]
MLKKPMKRKSVKELSNGFVCLLLSLSVLSQSHLSSQPIINDCEQECEAPCARRNLLWGAAAAGIAVGGVIAASSSRHGRKGESGSSGSRGSPGPAGVPGTPGATGPAGPTGPAGAPFVFPTGPASLGFTFTNQAVAFAGPILRGPVPFGPSYIPLIVMPDQTIITGVLMPANAPPQVLTIPAPAQIGNYQIVLYLDSNAPADELQTQPFVNVTNSLNPAEVATFSTTFGFGSPVGEQVTFEFTYSPAVIP